tara:strand:+ start:388 stop:594 length:207 start_codon:yes stop_codon:yes gene_type:complete
MAVLVFLHLLQERLLLVVEEVVQVKMTVPLEVLEVLEVEVMVHRLIIPLVMQEQSILVVAQEHLGTKV